VRLIYVKGYVLLFHTVNRWYYYTHVYAFNIKCEIKTKQKTEIKLDLFITSHNLFMKDSESPVYCLVHIYITWWWENTHAEK